MNDQPKFEEIRILGLETSEDEVTPGRSVFEEDQPSNDLPPWTDPPATSSSSDEWLEEEVPRWADDVPEEHESQQPVANLEDSSATYLAISMIRDVTWREILESTNNEIVKRHAVFPYEPNFSNIKKGKPLHDSNQWPEKNGLDREITEEVLSKFGIK